MSCMLSVQYTFYLVFSHVHRKGGVTGMTLHAQSAIFFEGILIISLR